MYEADFVNIKRKIQEDPTIVHTWKCDIGKIHASYFKRTSYFQEWFHKKSRTIVPTTKKETFDLPSIVKSHYQKYGDQHWISYLREWLPVADAIHIAVIILDNSVVITGFALTLKDFHSENECYVRLLCSACKCGKILLQSIHTDSERRGIQRMALHSEPTCVGFYQKQGYHMVCTNYEENDLFVRYPMMIFPLQGVHVHDVLAGEVICKTFFFGYWHYLQTYAVTIMWFLLAITCVFLFGMKNYDV